MYLNKAIVIGNLTRDPEMKSLPAGIKVTTFSVATNRVWKDATGAKKEAADYHNIVVFGRQAETSAQYLKRGQSVLVEGRMQTRSWDDPSGKKMYRTEIVAESVQFGAKAGTGAPVSTPSVQNNAPAPIPGDPGVEAIEYPSEDSNLEDIPF